MNENIIQRIRCVQPETLTTLEGYLRQGIPIKEIASNWNVSHNVVYYWIYKTKLPIKKIKYGLIIKNKKTIEPVKKYTYYYYLQQSFKRGSITKGEKIKALNQYYQNRYKDF